MPPPRPPGTRRSAPSPTSPTTTPPPVVEDDYTVIEQVGTPARVRLRAARPRRARPAARRLRPRARRQGVSGSRFYFLTGVGAQLQLALVNMAMDQARAAGFIQTAAPSLVRPRAMEGTGFLGQAADDVYRIEGEDLYLVGTSRGADGGVPLRRDPRRRLAAAALRRLQPVLPQGGRLARQGHPRDLAGALVRQGRDVRLHDRSRSPTPSTSGCWRGRRSSSTSSSSATA